MYASGPIKIVAIGSSTTAGEGGVVAYPYRLEEALRATYQGRMVDVLNRGKGGDEARTELARLETDVLREKPALVIWQVGTNAVWKWSACHVAQALCDAIADGVVLAKQAAPRA